MFISKVITAALMYSLEWKGQLKPGQTICHLELVLAIISDHILSEIGCLFCVNIELCPVYQFRPRTSLEDDARQGSGCSPRQ